MPVARQVDALVRAMLIPQVSRGWGAPVLRGLMRARLSTPPRSARRIRRLRRRLDAFVRHGLATYLPPECLATIPLACPSSLSGTDSVTFTIPPENRPDRRGPVLRTGTPASRSASTSPDTAGMVTFLSSGRSDHGSAGSNGGCGALPPTRAPSTSTGTDGLANICCQTGSVGSGPPSSTLITSTVSPCA